MDNQSKTMYHSGHRELQKRFDGVELADALEQMNNQLTFQPKDKEFIENVDFFFLATAFKESVDCSFKGGVKGFIKVTGENTLEFPDYDGNSMYRSLGNILKSPYIGMIFIEFSGQPRRLRVNGQATIREDKSGSDAKLIISVTATEIFPNCPRYVPDLQSNKPSKFLPDKSGYGAKPDWKNQKEYRNYLPKNDPHNS
jgi:predicted pyridoxine 5'-phosphate oxidase superfamily flavin-nucleotide-binding protein